MMVNIKSAAEIVKMQRSGEIVALAHAAVAEAIAPGISTQELDEIAAGVIRAKGAMPSFLNYNGFPKSICASINDVVIHGIPSETMVLREGDIVGVDIGALFDGYHGDRAVTYGVGRISEQARDLMDATEQAFYEGIRYAREGQRISDISAAVQRYAQSRGYSVVREFVGHGVGRALHEPPEVPNYGQPGHGTRLYAGMTIAVEPMINAGGREVRIEPDGWTVRTADGSLSAHFEHTIALTKHEPLLLTVAQ